MDGHQLGLRSSRGLTGDPDDPGIAWAAVDSKDRSPKWRLVDIGHGGHDTTADCSGRRRPNLMGQSTN